MGYRQPEKMMLPAELMTETDGLGKTTYQSESQKFLMPNRVCGKLGMTWPLQTSSGMVGKASCLLVEEYCIFPVAIPT